MSRFVKEGTAPTSELELEEARAKELEEKFLEEEKLRERKSLLEQLNDHRLLKALELQLQTELQNSAYKVTEKDMEYYTLLRERELQKDRDTKSVESRGLEEFRR